MKKQIFPVVIGVIKKDGKYLLTKRQSPKKLLSLLRKMVFEDF